MVQRSKANGDIFQPQEADGRRCILTEGEKSTKNEVMERPMHAPAVLKVVRSVEFFRKFEG